MGLSSGQGAGTVVDGTPGETHTASQRALHLNLLGGKVVLMAAELTPPSLGGDLGNGSDLWVRADQKDTRNLCP